MATELPQGMENQNPAQPQVEPINTKTELNQGLEEIKEKVEAVADQVVEFAKDTKEKYDTATPETKEKIKKGVIGGAAALLAIIGLKKLFGKKD